jgi:long-chain acyl-CoA synthetase
MSKGLAKAMFHLNLAPEVHAEDKVWKFLGIFSKNREEWIISELAGISQGITTVPLYDTLGPESVEYVINQTLLTTIACAGSYVPGLV